jgi:DNA repair exonuclease SbcCD nuclease subunit
MITFIHTADWQIGKPYGIVENEEKRVLLQQERISAIARIGQIARNRKAEFILVAGDLFDSTTPTKATVSATCRAIGNLNIPVYVIPGNHDHGGAGGLWDQPFYINEQKSLAPNLTLLLSNDPVDIGSAILFPCPLLRRHESNDLTAWLRTVDFNFLTDPQKPRIIIAHGTVQGFGEQNTDDENDAPVNYVDVDRIERQNFDYIALGDWHGTKQINDRTWYSGTHEIDRFLKGEEHNPGNILIVTAGRGRNPEVEIVRTTGMNWNSLNFEFNSDENITHFNTEVEEILGSRVNEDMFNLTLKGALGLKVQGELEETVDRLRARLISLKLQNQVVLAPTEEEIMELTDNNSNHLIKNVASRLMDMMAANNQEAELARTALRELYFTINTKDN